MQQLVVCAVLEVGGVDLEKQFLTVCVWEVAGELIIQVFQAFGHFIVRSATEDRKFVLKDILWFQLCKCESLLRKLVVRLMIFKSSDHYLVILVLKCTFRLILQAHFDLKKNT